MFETLSDQQPHATKKEWTLRFLAILAISLVLFLALYYGVRSAG